MAKTTEANRFNRQYTDLASRRFGAQALACSDDFFAEMENMLLPEPAQFIADRYTHHGKWMDGWESRRRRHGGHDWCIVRLGLPGQIRGVDVDTSFFLGNAPKQISLEACRSDVAPDGATTWVTLLTTTPVEPGSHNLLDVPPSAPAPEAGWTHLRLNIYPDGGVARLRVYGEVCPDWRWYLPGELVDLAALENGARPLACSDDFFGVMENALMPGRGAFMGDGWETRRRRGGPDHDWMIVKLGRSGLVRKVELDTAHFKGNFPESFALEGCLAQADACPDETGLWIPLIGRTVLSADRNHRFLMEVQGGHQPVSHIRLKIYPDGGVSRLRVWCEPQE
jgi:allantoicase